MTMEKTLDKIFGYDFENVFTNIEKKNRTIWKVLINEKLLLISIQCHYKRTHRPVLVLILDYRKQPKLPLRQNKKMEVKTGHSSTTALKPVTAKKWKTTSLA